MESNGDQSVAENLKDSATISKDENSLRKRTIRGILKHLKFTDNNDSNIKEELTVLSDENYEKLKVPEDILIISNFPNWTCDSIEEYVMSKCGPEIKIKRIKTESSIDSTVILTFEDSLHRKSAMERLRNIYIDGRKLEVHSIDNSDSPSSIDSAEPEVKRSKSEDSTGLLEEKSEEDDLNTYGLNIHYLKALNISLPIDKWVHVSNFRCDKSELKEVLEMAGRVVICLVKLTVCRFAKVMYSHPLEAVQAVSMLNGQTYYGLKLNVSMDTQRGGMILLPKGLSAVGPGLGIRREPLWDVAKHFKKFKSGKMSLLNTSLFSNSDAFPEDFFNNNFKSINLLWGSESVDYEKNNDKSSPNVESTHPIPSSNSLKERGREISLHPSISEPLSPRPPGVASPNSVFPCNSESSLSDIEKVSSPKLQSPDIGFPQTEAMEKTISESDISSPTRSRSHHGAIDSMRPGKPVSPGVKTSSSSSPINTPLSVNSPSFMGNNPRPSGHLGIEPTAMLHNINKPSITSSSSGFFSTRFSQPGNIPSNIAQPLIGQINRPVRPFAPNMQYCGSGSQFPGPLPINNRFNCPSVTGPRPTGPMSTVYMSRLPGPTPTGHMPTNTMSAAPISSGQVAIGPRPTGPMPPVHMSRLPGPMPSCHMPTSPMSAAPMSSGHVPIGPRPIGPMFGGSMPTRPNLMDPRITSPQPNGNRFPNAPANMQPTAVSFSNLPPTTTFTELSQKLSQVGQLLSMQFTTMGCAIATFANFEQATKCIQMYSGMCVNGNAVKVTFV